MYLWYIDTNEHILNTSHCEWLMKLVLCPSAGMIFSQGLSMAAVSSLNMCLTRDMRRSREAEMGQVTEELLNWGPDLDPSVS